ncbi:MULTISPECIES: TonB-dependent receptor [Citromicrobium]|uniref:TonB-dependent receptor n=1 Tax=Citromicrobium TaxID=72173 RepID=UPI0001DD1098|nr:MULTISPECIES: TonB-dependent receptor [Citromicrobium]ALG60976.1 ligand-gated channel [Citromicrobium sp. JL477]KPM12161.1 ligand-gated channel [Citromicrobium sp. JL31]KPM15137.1 ligand-gated channel [Citromicrobium sp. JL1351]
MNLVLRGVLLSSAATALVAGVSPALAQDSEVSSDSQADEPQEGGIGEIVVTARKREESLQDVPVAVSAFDEKLIENRDITSVEKIAAIAPNFNVGRASNGSGAQLTLRGIGSSSTSIGIEQSVAVVVDGAYYGQGRVIQEGFFDLQRVEVLKGPQALFFGKNATAGVISITSADPGPNPEFMLRGGYEFQAQQYRVEGVASVPLSDTVGVRLAARYSNSNKGYYRNESVDRTYSVFDLATSTTEDLIATPAPTWQPAEEEFIGRATLKIEPSDRLTLTLKGTFDSNNVNNSSWNYVPYACGLPSGVSQLTEYACERDFVTHQNNIPAAIAASGFPFARQDGSLYNRYRSAAGTLNVQYDADVLQISSVTNYQWTNNRWACACDFQSSDISNWATENSSWKAFSQELRALSQLDGPFNFMVGALYQTTKRDFEQYIILGGVANSAAPPGFEYVGTSKTSFTDGDTLAVFGQATFEITPTLEVSAGGRYTTESKDSFFTQPYNNPGLAAIFRPQDDPDGLGVITASQDFTDFSPEATITWKPSTGLMIYGAYKTAYKSGGFSNGGINSKFSADPKDDLTFDPETAEGFEFGIKSTLLDRQLRLNLTLFTYDYKDLQVDFFNSPIFAFQTLTADARTRGVELEFEFAPRGVPGLNLSGSINYTDAQYTDFPLAPCYAGQTVSEGCTLIGGITARQDLTGAALSVAPDWTGNLGVVYEMPVGSSMKLGFNADARYSDEYLASGFGNPLSLQDRYVTLDVGVRFGADDDNWTLAVIGKNLTNQFYVTGVVDGPQTGSGTGTATGVRADQVGFGSLPRTVMVEVTKRF